MDENIAPSEVGVEQHRASRRTLLKGAVGVGVGVAVYSAPGISVVPAYGFVGTGQSDLRCVWFSPNHNKGSPPYLADQGDWHDEWGNNAAPPSPSDEWQPLKVTVPITIPNQPQKLAWVMFDGNPNKHPPPTAGPDWTSLTGGLRITVEPGCKIDSIALGCSAKIGVKSVDDKANPLVQNCPATPPNATAAPASWALGSSTNPIGTPNQTVYPGGTLLNPQVGNPPTGNVALPFSEAYYHTNRSGEGEGDRCKLGITFTVRCGP